MDVFGVVSRWLANAPIVPDGNATRPRTDRRGELYTEALWARLEALAEEGSLFAAMTVPGTGVTATAATGTVFSATQGLLTIANTDTPGAKNVIPLLLRLIITTAGTASTDLHIAHALDDGNRGSGGTPGLMTGVNVNGGFPNDAIAQVRFGVPTVAAAGANVRYLDTALLRGAIPIVKDVYEIVFGATDQPSGGVNLAQGNAAVISVLAPPIIIPPGKCYVLHEWSTARSAAQAAEARLLYAVR